MKKAYNVYFNFERTFVKAAMLTSLFALCFLFSGTMSAQQSSPYEISIGLDADVKDQLHDLDADLIADDVAVSAVRNLYKNHLSTSNPTMSLSQEIEYSIRSVFLSSMVNMLGSGQSFAISLSYASSMLEAQVVGIDMSQYDGPTVNAIIEGYLINFK